MVMGSLLDLKGGQDWSSVSVVLYACNDFLTIKPKSNLWSIFLKYQYYPLLFEEEINLFKIKRRKCELTEK
jgi:hypothetical protein